MHKVTINSAGLDEGLAAFAGAWKAGMAEIGSRISFADPDLLWTVLTARRWALLKLLAGKEPMSLRAVSRAAGRDVKGVHTDVHALVDAGILRRDEHGRITFPFDEVHVDFLLRAA
jgi:predicted transcriptional regulator